MAPVITKNMRFIGEQHDAVRQVKKLASCQAKNDLILLDGIWGQIRVLETTRTMELLLLCPECIVSKEAAELAEKLISIAKESYCISKKTFWKLSDRDDPDGFLSVVRLPQFHLSRMIICNSSVIAVLDGLENPGNIGTILRSCDGAGVDALFICNRRARLGHPKLVKGSMGAVLTVPIVTFDSVSACKEWLMQNGFRIYLADTRAAAYYDEHVYAGKSAVIIGNERYGLSNEWYSKDSCLLSIPMNGHCDSLNAGVAASILLYQICRTVKYRK